MVTESLKKYLDACVSVRSKRHQLFLGNVRLCSAIFGNFRKMFGNDCLAYGQLLGTFGNLQKVFGNLWKIVKKSLLVSLYDKPNNTYLLVDMEFLFECST